MKSRPATMLEKVLHIVPRSFLETLAREHVKIPFPHHPARQFLEGRIFNAATPALREAVAHYLHGQICPPCVTKREP